MKKCLKEIIIVASILYFVLSLGYTFIARVVVSEEIEALTTNPIYNSIDFTVAGEESEYIKLQKELFTGEEYVINTNIQLLIVSVGIGIMVGLIKSVKENSWIKYILIFIFGNITYTAIWTIIDLIINASYGNNVLSNFFSRYMYIEKSTIMYYIIVYIAILVWMLVNNKSKVENLNKSLKNPTKEKNRKNNLNKKKIKKVIITVVSIILVTITIMIARRSIILIKYEKKLNQISTSTNYYIKENDILGDGSKFESEIYFKDGVCLRKYSNQTVSYRNSTTKESFTCNYNLGKISMFKDTYAFQTLYMQNQYFADNSVRTMASIVFSFNIGITSQKYNEKDCYVIKYNGGELFIDKDTYLVVRETQKEENGISTCDYIFKEGIVTDTDIQRPSIEGLTEITLNQSK